MDLSEVEGPCSEVLRSEGHEIVEAISMERLEELVVVEIVCAEQNLLT